MFIDDTTKKKHFLSKGNVLIKSVDTSKDKIFKRYQFLGIIKMSVDTQKCFVHWFVFWADKCIKC